MKVEKLTQRYLRVSQVADYTGLSVATIRARVLSKQVPYIKREGCVLFDINQIDAWMEGAQVTRIESNEGGTEDDYSFDA
ncbi:MAG: helix-turn-helix domain-containing protein [Sphaerochaeta sp.]|jgi:predicted DNA-binding transcriptional regulator AlpA